MVKQGSSALQHYRLSSAAPDRPATPARHGASRSPLIEGASNEPAGAPLLPRAAGGDRTGVLNPPTAPAPSTSLSNPSGHSPASPSIEVETAPRSGRHPGGPQQAVSVSIPLAADPCEIHIGEAASNGAERLEDVGQRAPTTQLAETFGLGEKPSLPVIVAHMAAEE